MMRILKELLEFYTCFYNMYSCDKYHVILTPVRFEDSHSLIGLVNTPQFRGFYYLIKNRSTSLSIKTSRNYHIRIPLPFLTF